MNRKIAGLLLVAMFAGISSLVWAEAEKEGAACVAQDGAACQAQPEKSQTEAPVALEQAKSDAAAESTAATLAVEEITMATAVENRTAVGAAESFPAGTEKLYCLTKITGGKEGDTIVHKWSHDGVMVSEVTLKVNGSPWRTFSSKTLGENAAGAWTVDILQNGNVLKTIKAEVAK